MLRGTGGDAGGETGGDAGGDGLVGGGDLCAGRPVVMVEGVGTGCSRVCVVTDGCPSLPLLVQTPVVTPAVRPVVTPAVTE